MSQLGRQRYNRVGKVQSHFHYHLYRPQGSSGTFHHFPSSLLPSLSLMGRIPGPWHSILQKLFASLCVCNGVSEGGSRSKSISEVKDYNQTYRLSTWKNLLGDSSVLWQPVEIDWWGPRVGTSGAQHKNAGGLRQLCQGWKHWVPLRRPRLWWFSRAWSGNQLTKTNPSPITLDHTFADTWGRINKKGGRAFHDLLIICPRVCHPSLGHHSSVSKPESVP